MFPAIGSANPSLTSLSLARRTAAAIIAARARPGSPRSRSTPQTGPWSPRRAPTRS
jgi:hypothetical protein